MYCHNCGERFNPDKGRFCTKCGTEVHAAQSKSQRRKNRYDEGVKEWITSKTFKTLLTIGLIGGCCFGACSMVYYGSLMGLLGSLLSPPQSQQQTSLQQPYIVRTTSEKNPIDENTKATLNTWLATSAPADTPYWFVTSWQREEDGRFLVSIAGVRLSNPDETWHLVDDEENKVIWIGNVEVLGSNVKLLYP